MIQNNNLSKKLITICKNSDWDWTECRDAVSSGELDSKQCLHLCKKTNWDWDVCRSCLEIGVFGIPELIQMLKKKQNPNVVYALKFLGCSYSDIEKYMIPNLKAWIKNSTIFLTPEQIREKIAATGLYDTSNKNYFIAYKGVKKNRQSKYAYNSPYYNYQDGRDFRAFANYDQTEQNSYGLSVWTEQAARDYESGIVLKVKVPYNSVAALVHKNTKLRVTNFHVMHAVGAEQEYVEKQAAKKQEMRARINWYRNNKQRVA